MPKGRPPLRPVYARPELTAYGSPSSFGNTLSSSIGSTKRNTKALQLSVAMLNGADTGSWTSGVSSQQNLSGGGNTVRFVLGLQRNPSATGMSFLATGTPTYSMQLSENVITPVTTNSDTYTEMTGQYTGSNSSTIYIPGRTFVHGADLRLAIVGIYLGGNGATPTIYPDPFKWTEMGGYNDSNWWYRVYAGATASDNTDIDLSSFTMSAACNYGAMTLNVRNAFR